MGQKINGYYIARKLIDAILYATIIWIALFLIFYDSAMVYDISMQPTLNAISGVTDNDIVYYRKWNRAEVGDIVIISTGDELIIKRVIGMSGDKIRYVYDRNSGVYDLYINNSKVEEEYIKEDITPEKLSTSKNPIKFSDPTDETGFNPFGVLKNNQPFNFDEEGNYIVPVGQVFVMGDNRIYSTDSKSHGGYDIANIEGVVELIINSKDNVFFKVLDFVF